MTGLFPTTDDRMAVISPCGLYRYALSRTWGDDPANRVNFIMLNPSTADATQDDPTIRRCIGFAKSWGHAGLTVTNLFAFRATDPRDMQRAADPVGPDNDARILAEARASNLVVMAWGAHGTIANRAIRVMRMIEAAGLGFRLHALAWTKEGQPRHPLYLAANLTPIPLPRIGPA